MQTGPRLRRERCPNTQIHTIKVFDRRRVTLNESNSSRQVLLWRGAYVRFTNFHTRLRLHETYLEIRTFAPRERKKHKKRAPASIVYSITILFRGEEKSRRKSPSQPTRACKCISQVGVANDSRAMFVPRESRRRVFSPFFPSFLVSYRGSVISHSTPSSFIEFAANRDGCNEARATSARDYRCGAADARPLIGSETQVSPPSREYSAAGGVNDLPLSVCTHEGDTTSSRLSVCRRRRSRMTSFSLIARCRWPRSRSPLGFLRASRDSTTPIVCQRVRIILR